MTDARTDQFAGFPAIDLPLVSVVVVNYNYGRFLQDAVGSVFGQSYPRMECILVDNASTDDSATYIAALQERYRDLRVIHRSENGGQTPASLDGFAASSGHYVIFLDADDFLLPRSVETHIYVHLSMRNHIGFTSGDMLQVVGNEVVVSTGEESSRFIRGPFGKSKRRLRPYSHQGGFDWPSADVRASIKDKVFYVRPHTTRWVWSPTSGLCYRRDALSLFADNPALADLRTGTDMYFALGCGGLSGSALIDEPLFAYRIHGGNIFTQRAQLDRFLVFKPGGVGDNNSKAQLLLIDHLVATADRFTRMLWVRLDYLLLILGLDTRDRTAALPTWARRSRLAQAIVQHYDSFSEAVGPGFARIVLAWSSKTIWSPRKLAASLARHKAAKAI